MMPGGYFDMTHVDTTRFVNVDELVAHVNGQRR